MKHIEESIMKPCNTWLTGRKLKLLCRTAKRRPGSCSALCVERSANQCGALLKPSMPCPCRTRTSVRRPPDEFPGELAANIASGSIWFKSMWQLLSQKETNIFWDGTVKDKFRSSPTTTFKDEDQDHKHSSHHQVIFKVLSLVKTVCSVAMKRCQWHMQKYTSMAN